MIEIYLFGISASTLCSLLWKFNFLPERSMFSDSRKRSRAHTEVHILEESPLKELKAGKLS